MNFRGISIKRAYSSDTDDILHDFYIPVLAAATEYQRIAGFFSSTSLAIAAKGIVGLIANGGTMQLIVSPRLTQQDLEILMESNVEPQDFLAQKMLGDDLPPIAIPPVRSKLQSFSPLEQVVDNQASYAVGCDYTPASTVRSRFSLLSAL